MGAPHDFNFQSHGLTGATAEDIRKRLAIKKAQCELREKEKEEMPEPPKKPSPYKQWRQTTSSTARRLIKRHGVFVAVVLALIILLSE